MCTQPLDHDAKIGQFFKMKFSKFEFRVFLLPARLRYKSNWVSLSYYLSITAKRIVGFILFIRVLGLWEMRKASSKIWNRDDVSISYANNHCTLSASSLNKAYDLSVWYSIFESFNSLFASFDSWIKWIWKVKTQRTYIKPLTDQR